MSMRFNLSGRCAILFYDLTFSFNIYSSFILLFFSFMFLFAKDQGNNYKKRICLQKNILVATGVKRGKTWKELK